ncbi:MAG: aspartate-semialdehyde dehydrogenase [Bacteroidetes bacterium]|jgi:aspartate-semialdehyde dehydrogenase|nr:aspartate-semialdehyde dehydrogenase [Bacteroidota bacterium]
MKIAVVGATGLVGTKMLQILEERNFPVTELLPAASANSIGKSIEFKGQKIPVISLEQAVAAKPHIALFSAGGSVSLEWAPRFAENGTVVIDNSSAWRMDPNIPLVVPEVNPNAVLPTHKIIANPNCSTIQMVVALQPLHEKFQLKRVVVSTYQSVTGTGQKAVQQMFDERAGNTPNRVYPHPIDLNALPHIDVFMPDGYTKEEWKMMVETRKIMGLPALKITATTVRIPTMGGHSESINASFEKAVSVNEIKDILSHAPGVTLQDNPEKFEYPMPLSSHNKDDVFVGRIRMDESETNAINLWVVSDNLRKGAATNAIQIAEMLVQKGWFTA